MADIQKFKVLELCDALRQGLELESSQFKELELLQVGKCVAKIIVLDLFLIAD